jgi:hypothetical protein
MNTKNMNEDEVGSYNMIPTKSDVYLKIVDVSPTEAPPSDGISKITKWPRVYTDTPTGEPISLTEDEFNNMVEAFRLLAVARDRNKTPA